MGGKKCRPGKKGGLCVDALGCSCIKIQALEVDNILGEFIRFSTQLGDAQQGLTFTHFP